MLGLNGIIDKNFPKCKCCKKKLVPLRVRFKKKRLVIKKKLVNVETLLINIYFFGFV